jgi:hypothetical protein
MRGVDDLAVRPPGRQADMGREGHHDVLHRFSASSPRKPVVVVIVHRSESKFKFRFFWWGRSRRLNWEHIERDTSKVARMPVGFLLHSDSWVCE